MKNLPKITILIVTLNNERSIEKCLKHIISQDYPKELIEYLNVDGGSTDLTKQIFKKYGFRTIESPVKRNAEAQRAIGIKQAKNNLIVSIDADNYLPNNKWLLQMVKPFMDDPSIVHANTLHYMYKKTDSIYNRYCALFGVVDPIVYYLGTPDRLPKISTKWKKGKIIKETKDYYIVEFDKKTLPTVGCNGVAYRRDILLKYAKSSPKDFLHMDVFMDLIEKNYNKFAIVKNSVTHDTAVTISSLLKKRIAFLNSYYFSSKSAAQRRYFIYNPKKIEDNLKLFLFILYTVTFVKPIADSLRGYLIIRDRAWFLHPIICWIYFSSYSFATIRQFLKK